MTDADNSGCNKLNIDDNEQRISAAPVDNGIINNDEAAPVRNIADNIDDDKQLNDAAPVENFGNQANNNDPHDVVDEQSNDTAAPVHNIADSMDDNEQLSDKAPVENVTNHASNNVSHDVADEQLIGAVVGNENIETHYVAIHNNGTTLTAPTIMYLNDQLELMDRRIHDLEAKIVDLESKMTALSDTVGYWPKCTSNDSRFSYKSDFSLGEGLNFVGQGEGRGDGEVGDKEEDSGSGDQKRNAHKRKHAPEGEAGKGDNKEDERGNCDQKRKAHKRKGSRKANETTRD